MHDPADIHHYGRRLGQALKLLDRDGTIPPGNRKIIREYIRFRNAQGLSIPRQVRYLSVLRKLSRVTGRQLKGITREDVMEFVEHTNVEATSPETKRTEREVVKMFVRWLRNGENAEEYPEEVRWLKTGTKANDRRLPESLLTEEEIKRMAGAAPNPMDRAFILSLYESGARIGEWLSLTVGSVSSSEYGYTVHIPRGKTGARRVLLIASSGAIAEWLNAHPSAEPPMPLWTSMERAGSTERWEYAAPRKTLQVVAAGCGIRKRVNPHSYRHARATVLAKALTEQQLKAMLGWVNDSKMASVYVHLSGADVDRALCKMNGIETGEAGNGNGHVLHPLLCICKRTALRRQCRAPYLQPRIKGVTRARVRLTVRAGQLVM
ncbi:MAG: tyrosine-type recombinase/integrase [Methanomassiliicoccales archaeon]